MSNNFNYYFKIKAGKIICYYDVRGVIVDNTIEIDFNGTAVEILYAQQTYLNVVTLFGGNGLPVAPFDLFI